MRSRVGQRADVRIGAISGPDSAFCVGEFRKRVNGFHIWPVSTVLTGATVGRASQLHRRYMNLRAVLGQSVFTRAQLRAAGMSDRTIKRRVADGLFQSIGPGLLCHTGSEQNLRVLGIAAHRQSDLPLTGPAAALHFPPGPVSELVTDTRPWLIGAKRASPEAVYVRHPQPEVVTRNGLRVASPRQAALDCIRVLRDSRDLVYRCAQQGLLRPIDLQREAKRLAGHKGVGRLREAAEMISSNAHAESENLFHKRLREAGITDWLANLWVITSAGLACIDIAFPESLLAIEYDSPVTHAQTARFRQDRRKWNGLKRQGWEVLNYGWDAITDTWAETLEEIQYFRRKRADRGQI